jgi:hypothetical protein
MSNRKSHAPKHTKKISRLLADMYARADVPCHLAPPTPRPGETTTFAPNRKFRRHGRYS